MAVVCSVTVKDYQLSVRLVTIRILKCLITRRNERSNMQFKHKNVRKLESQISNVYGAFKNHIKK